MSDLTGTTLGGRYRIEALIGRGGMADVYRASDLVLDRIVAVKILTDRSEDIRRRFLREAQAMAKFNHRNIVAVYDVGRTETISYIVMELVVGRTLGDIPLEELTVHRLIRFFIDLLEGLSYAHEQGVIHRDIKPANVMVLNDDTVKVMDFGLSRRTTEMSSVTNAGEIVGTVAYLSPERFLGKTADARSDLYSVGIVMYEKFTGTVPFKSETDDLVAVIFAHVNEPPQPPRTINRGLHPEIEAIIMRLIEKDPDMRFQGAYETTVALRALIEPGPKGAEKPAPSAPPRRMPGPPPLIMQNEIAVRDALDKTFGSTQLLNEGYSAVLAGMLSARKRDYPEAIRSYGTALDAFSGARNDVEYAKTALRYAATVYDKNSDMPRPEKAELDLATAALQKALPVVRARRMLREVEEGERLLYSLGRIGVRIR